jgi:hypothetical protein
MGPAMRSDDTLPAAISPAKVISLRIYLVTAYDPAEDDLCHRRAICTGLHS